MHSFEISINPGLNVAKFCTSISIVYRVVQRKVAILSFFRKHLLIENNKYNKRDNFYIKFEFLFIKLMQKFMKTESAKIKKIFNCSYSVVEAK